MSINPKHAELLLQQLHVLVVDDNPFMRAIVRGLLNKIGVKQRHRSRRRYRRAGKDPRGHRPTSSSSTGKCRCSTGRNWCGSCARPAYSRRRTFPSSCSPRHGEHWRILELVKLGVNEFLCKPVSAQALFERLISIVLKPRASVQVGKYYGPVPRIPAPDPATGTPSKGPPAA